MSLWDEVEQEAKLEVVDVNEYEAEKDRFAAVEKIAVMVASNEDEKNRLLELLENTAGLNGSKKKFWLKRLFSKLGKNGRKQAKLNTNQYLANPNKSLQLISDLLKTEPRNSSIDKLYNKYCEILEGDFMAFADIDDLPNEAEMYSKLLAIKDGIETDVLFENMANKKIIGIGGGFSAGKSSFVNAILSSPTDILPTDTRPTTSIPTYIIGGKDDICIYSNNLFGEKTVISKDALLAISHEFYRVFKLSLNSIIKKISIETKYMKYRHIAFLDTPGYTKNDNALKNDNTDEQAAKMHLVNSDSLIWIIDIEQGTVPKNDINFLTSVAGEKPVFIIFNKADKKPVSEIENILNKAKTLLETKSINVQDVIAYSSLDKIEYCSNNSIEEYLDSIDKKSDQVSFTDQVIQVIQVYEQHHDNAISKQKNLLKVLNKVDTLAYKQIAEIPEYSDALKVTRDEIKTRKKVQSVLAKVKSKMLKITQKIDSHFN